MDRGIFLLEYPRLIAENLSRSFWILPQVLRGPAVYSSRRPDPTTKGVSFTNFCDITVRFNRKQLVVFAAITTDQRRKRRCYSKYEPDARMDHAGMLSVR